MIKKNNYLIYLVVLFAFLLRIIALNYSPPSLNWDEISHGYNAYSILKSGADEWGVKFPLIFRAYGDYKLPLYIYFTAFFQLFFGLGTYSIRITSVLAGTLSVYFTYLLTKQLLGKLSSQTEKIALLAALLMAIEPWSFFLSRGAFEANLSLTFIISGFYFLDKYQKKSFGQALGLSLLGMSVWTYNSARVFTPMMLLVYLILYRKELGRSLREKVIILISFLIFFAPMFYQLLQSSGQARFGWVTFVNDTFINEIIHLRNVYDLSYPIERLLFNRYTYFVFVFIKNYFSHFSPSFLFIKGGSHYQFGIPETGLLYPVDMVFVLLGILSLIQKKTREAVFVFMWLLLSPVASSLTVDTPHNLRAIVMLPMPMILSAYGFVSFVAYIRTIVYKNAVVISYFVVVIFFFVAYQKNYYTNYRINYSWVYQYGHQQMVDYVKQQYGNYNYILITKEYGEPHEFLLYYWPWDPESYMHDSNLIRFYQSNWYWVDGFDKFYFVNSWDIPEHGNQFHLESSKTIDCHNKKCLLVSGSKSTKADWQKVKEITDLKGEIVFNIYKK